ncbi:hypothetical protein [Candidatus Methanodesulfokora washburnensis]|jgi:hypothetical protein|nr:hypothetical protein [Candidatus Methanodesulfokores washburnensis]
MTIDGMGDPEEKRLIEEERRRHFPSFLCRWYYRGKRKEGMRDE